MVAISVEDASDVRWWLSKDSCLRRTVRCLGGAALRLASSESAVLDLGLRVRYGCFAQPSLDVWFGCLDAAFDELRQEVAGELP